MRLGFAIFVAALLCGCTSRQPAEPVRFQPDPRYSGEPVKVKVVGKQSESRSEAEISSGEEALQTLREGNERFVRSKPWHPRQNDQRREMLSGTQKPHTIVLSCSDSRVPPELVFDQGLGDLFVVRTAGEVADPAAVASIEYAVEHLGAKLLLVMGHQSCGAVKAALSTPKGKSAGSKDLDRLVAAIRSHLKGTTSENAGDNLQTAVSLQASGVAAELLKRSKIIREAVNHHHLKMAQAVYHLGSGEVEFLPTE